MVNSGEFRPTSGPVRKSALRRIEEMPSAQDMLNGPSRETALMRYVPSEDPLDPPRVFEVDTPFTKGDSGEFAQEPLSSGEAFAGSGVRWMSQAAVDAYMLEAEQAALAEIRASQGLPQKRELEFRYSGPDAHINLSATEGIGGDKIDQILAALSGRALQRQTQAPQYLAQDSYAPTPSYFPARETPLAIDAPQRPLTADTLMDASQNSPDRMGFIRRHRKGLAKIALVGSMYFWFRPVGNVFYEVAKQGVRGEVASMSDIALAFEGKEVSSGANS